MIGSISHLEVCLPLQFVHTSALVVKIIVPLMPSDFSEIRASKMALQMAVLY